jgi:5-methylcytosine-specific restriction endonuclease McrA
MNYKDKLKTKEWYQRRSLILKRDQYKCTKCSSTKNLQVHHKAYVIGRDPHEYTDENLVTLCNICHEKEHRSKDIKEFIVKSLPVYIPPERKIQKIFLQTSQIFEFGMYKGMNLEEISDLKYLQWYLGKVKSNHKKLGLNKRK